MTVSLQTLMTQFRARYPMGSLLSEFQTVHDGLFIVRAIAQIGGTPLSSGLAAEPTLEQAEDRAKIRAIEALGIQSFMPAIAPNSLSDVKIPDILPDPAVADAALVAIAPPIRPTAPEPILLTVAKPEPGFAVEADLDLSDTALTEPDEIPEFRSPPSPPSKEVRRKAAPEPAAETVVPPMDLSDVIAQTSVELKRLGWTEPQGRKHLQQTYNKRSRQQLTDDELLDFLNYLQTQPSP